jgi:hypothetical protein
MQLENGLPKGEAKTPKQKINHDETPTIQKLHTI